MRTIILGFTIICISFYNAFIEGITAFRSMWMCLLWLANFCTYEVEIADEEGNIIHYFPQLNFSGDDE